MHLLGEAKGLELPQAVYGLCSLSSLCLLGDRAAKMSSVSIEDVRC